MAKKDTAALAGVVHHPHAVLLRGEERKACDTSAFIEHGTGIVLSQLPSLPRVRLQVVRSKHWASQPSRVARKEAEAPLVRGFESGKSLSKPPDAHRIMAGWW